MVAAVAQRGERVGGFARLRDGEEQRALGHHHVAVAVLARDLDAARDARDAFEPVTRDQARVEARAAGDDLHVLHLREQAVGVDAEDVGQDAVVGDATLERVGDRARLLEDLLQHVVAVLAALDRIGGHLALPHRAVRRLAVRVEDRVAVEHDLDQVAFLEVGEAGGFADQRLHVGAEVVLALADADHQRAAAARTDDVAGLRAVHHRDRVGAVQAPRGLEHGRAQVGAARERVVDEVRDHLGVGVRIETVAIRLQFAAQLRVVLDDAVVDHRDALVGDMRVRVGGVGYAVGGPARVRDAGGARDRRRGIQRFELPDLAGRAHARELSVFQHRDAGRVVAAVLQRLEAGDEQGHDIALGDGSDDSTHGMASSGSGGPPAAVMATNDRGSRAPAGRVGASCLPGRVPF